VRAAGAATTSALFDRDCSPFCDDIDRGPFAYRSFERARLAIDFHLDSRAEFVVSFAAVGRELQIKLGRIRQNQVDLAVARPRVDLTVTVTEEEIALAILRLVELEKSVVEGAAATPLAACMSGRLKELAGKRVVLLLCGGNIDPNVLSRVIERGLVADGRLGRFTAVISDRPGGLADLATQIASTGASVKQIVHDRAFASPDVSAVNVLCTVETRNHQHLAELRALLKSRGVEIHDAK